MGKMPNKEKIIKELENIMQLSTDAFYKVKYGDSVDIMLKIESIEEWTKSIKRRLKKEEKIINENNK